MQKKGTSEEVVLRTQTPACVLEMDTCKAGTLDRGVGPLVKGQQERGISRAESEGLPMPAHPAS